MADNTEELSVPGDVNLVSALIITLGGSTIDISAMIADLTLYEDIFSNTMSGFIILEDSLDLINSIPLVGQEQFVVELNTPSLNKSITKIFYIYKLQGKMTKKRVQTYMLNFCSRELIFSANSKVAKAFSGNITDTVVSIYNDSRYLSADSDIFVDRTQNDCSFIAPYWSPLETINWLAARSINEEGVPNFLFFETNQSYEFVSVESLLNCESERSYIYSDVDANTAYGVNGSKEDKYNIVESIENPVTFDYLRDVSSGMYASRLYTYDMTTKSIKTNSYDYIADFDTTFHLEEFPLKTDDLIRRQAASTHFIEKNNYQTGSFKSQGYDEYFLEKNSLLEQLRAFKLVIKVNGRTDIKAGNVINFKMNDMRQILGDEIDTEGTSDYYSGRYLITAIRHQIMSGKHKMFMEIVSDSFVKKLIVK